MARWLVIKADLAENDNRLKHNDRLGESKREEAGETVDNERPGYAKHTHIHSCAV